MTPFDSGTDFRSAGVRLIAADLGNSRVKLGLFSRVEPHSLPACDRFFATPIGNLERVLEFLDIVRQDSEMAAPVICGGVNPIALERLQQLLEESGFSAVSLTRPSAADIVNRTRNPERVGADRLFDAVAARRLQQPGEAMIVVDSGTATTVNLVDEEGSFRGGAILAGFGLLSRSLHQQTALLPSLDVTALTADTPALGEDTESALRSGLYWGLIGGIREIISRLQSEAAAGPAQVILTGGATPLIAPHFPNATVATHLTLQGIALCGAAVLRVKGPNRS